MARTNTRFIATHNAVLDICDTLTITDALPSENTLAVQLEVSRTIVRKVLAKLDEQNVIAWSGRSKKLLRPPTDADRLIPPPTLLSIEVLEDRFLNWVLRRDVPAGTALNVAQLSKDFSVATHTLQEFLASLARFGIVVRNPRGGWVLNGFTKDYAVELSDFRTLIELNSVSQLIKLPDDNPIWQKLDKLEQEHLELLEEIDESYHNFSQIDETFHRTINEVVNNRFVKEFQKVISLIFHYHFQWNKEDERARNESAINEHLVYLDALRSRDPERADKAARAHLATSKQTLLNSLRTNQRAT